MILTRKAGILGQTSSSPTDYVIQISVITLGRSGTTLSPQARGKLRCLKKSSGSSRSKWGKYKPTKPDAENWFKELADVMTQLGYWEDDNQIVDLRIVKYYAEKASIVIRWEELSDGKVNRE